MQITNRQARRFLLLKHGLLGEYKFIGKQGVVDYVRQTGCIQFDPIDVCGKNADLTLQSRVKGYEKEMLRQLLYEDRVLMDYPEKNTAIVLTEDWPYYARTRAWAHSRAQEQPELLELMEKALSIVREKGVVCPDDVQLNSDFKWRSYVVWSSGKNLSASVLEQLYGEGKLIIHHKQGTRKFYAPSENHIPAGLLSAPDPLPDDFDFLRWRTLRFIGAVGLMWCRPSDALPPMKADLRSRVFAELLREGRIAEVTVDGVRHPLYFRTEDAPIMELALQNTEFEPRCEFLAPLDCFMWDRKIISTLFGFDYTWEIYTPVAKRKYGYYVLPILLGERLIGRIEPLTDKKTGKLAIKNIWYEQGIQPTPEIQQAIDRRAAG